MKTPEEIKTDLVAWGTGVRMDIGCGEFVPPNPKYMLNGVRSSDVCRDALSYIKQLEAQVPKWISVEDRLPENRKIVLTYSKNNGFIFGAYTEIGWFFGKMCEDPTHWMPRPEPPKEEQ